MPIKQEGEPLCGRAAGQFHVVEIGRIVLTVAQQRVEHGPRATVA